jgi:hypothetical protein
MQPVASTRQSPACHRRNLRNGATCTTRRRASPSLQARLGGTELVVGSAGWGNNRRRMPPARCSRRRAAGESRCPASLADAAGRLLVQEGRGDKALLLVRSDSSEVGHRRRAMMGKAAAGADQSNEEVELNGGRKERSGWRFPW